MHRFLAAIAGAAGRQLLVGFATCAVAAGLMLELPVALASASASHSTARVGAAARLPAGSTVVGTLPASTALRATVVLKPQDPSSLAQYATAVSTPGSPYYRHYLTVSQFASRFGAAPSEISAVESALRSKGLSVQPATSNGLSIPIRGSAARLSAAFDTGFDQVRLRTGRTAYANTAAPQFPVDVANAVQGVVGLDSVDIPQPLEPNTISNSSPSTSTVTSHTAVAPHIGAGPQPCAGAQADTGTYTADQLASAYQFSSLYTAGDEGTGQTIALYELDNLNSSNQITFSQAYNTSDISTYEGCYTPSPSPSITNVSVGGAPVTTTGSGGGEVTLDLEDVIGLAPKANVIVYTGVNGGSGSYDTYAAIIDQNLAKVVSVSYGACELGDSVSGAEENALFEEAATQGQSILVASGDSGSEGCPGNTALAVEDPSSNPFVTAVGGTRVSAIGPPPTESVWNDTCNGSPCGGGGGISTLWNMPSYQSSAAASLNVTSNAYASGTPCATSSGDCREVPDVSADADPATGYAIYLNGVWQDIGGTSAATPTWASLIALANASSSCAGSVIGFANPSLYSLAGTAYSTYFNDVTTGNNDNDPTINGGKYPAGTGYDLASGLGTPNGASLTTGLCGLATATTTAPTASVLATVALPAGTSSMPTGVALDATNHRVYIAESKSNAAAEITGTNGTTFPTTATAVTLSGLNFPDDLAVDSSGNVYASDFCVGATTSVCAGDSASTSTVVSQAAQQDSFANSFGTGVSCPHPAGLASQSSYLLVACAGSGYIRACPNGISFGCGSNDFYQGYDQLASGAVPSGMALVPSGFMPIPSGAPSITGVVVADAAHNTVNLFGYGFTSGSNTNYDDTYTPATSLATGCEPANVAIGPQLTSGSVKTATVYVACPGNGTIEVGELWSNGTSSTSLAGLTGFYAVSLPTSGRSTPSPYGIAMNSAGTTLAVTDSANNDVVIYPSVSGEKLGTPAIAATGSVPDGVVVDGVNVFVANEGSGTVTVADPPAGPAPSSTRLATSMLGPRDNHLTVSDTPLVAPIPGRFSPPLHNAS